MAQARFILDEENGGLCNHGSFTLSILLDPALTRPYASRVRKLAQNVLPVPLSFATAPQTTFHFSAWRGAVVDSPGTWGHSAHRTA